MSLPNWYSQYLEKALLVNERKIFFVTGCQKSGTTWVQRLLNSHPQIACGGEGHIADHLKPLAKKLIAEYNAKQVCRRDVDLEVNLGDADEITILKLLSDRILAQYLQREEKPDSIRAIGDKTPENACLPEVLECLYPEAKFIHVIRDGRDAAVSGWAHLSRMGDSGYFTSFAEYAGYFATQHWSGYIRRMRAYAAKAPDRYLELKYEELHVNPREHMCRVMTFLGVDADMASLEQCCRGGSFEFLSKGRQRGEEDRNSFFRKGVVGEWKKVFDDEAIRQFQANADGWIEILGYEPFESMSHSDDAMASESKSLPA
ncbi:MAG: sulfotransferase [Planctomycetota bacterium]|nr:sulfotransferase [Planctomycetota bacterium]